MTASRFNDLSLKYVLNVPSDKPDDVAMPLVFCMHGRGADANDLALVGIYDRVPVGAIAGASATPGGLELRLTAGTRARRGHLVVGRRRSSGALVTAEVSSQVAPK